MNMTSKIHEIKAASISNASTHCMKNQVELQFTEYQPHTVCCYKTHPPLSTRQAQQSLRRNVDYLSYIPSNLFDSASEPLDKMQMKGQGGRNMDI